VATLEVRRRYAGRRVDELAEYRAEFCRSAFAFELAVYALLKSLRRAFRIVNDPLLLGESGIAVEKQLL
jgi:hypothetical protein